MNPRWLSPSIGDQMNPHWFTYATIFRRVMPAIGLGIITGDQHVTIYLSYQYHKRVPLQLLY